MEREKRKMTKNGETKGDPEQSIPSISEEVIVLNIFPRLPIKSLSQFRCVSKKWSSLITESKSQRQRALIMSLVGPNIPFHYINEKTHVKSLEQWWLRLFPKEFKSVKMLGSCNGLLLIGVDCDLFMWNPAIGYCRKVLSYERLGSDHYWVKSGFCYDHNEDDYKILMGLRRSCMKSENEFFVVGSVKNKTWTEIKFPYEFKVVKPGPVLHDCLHWSVSREGYARVPELNKIFYFDPRKNDFIDLPMPEPKKSYDANVLIGVGVLDDCISMARWEKMSEYDGNVEILIMKSYGVKESWEMLFKIEHIGFCDHVVPLFYADDGEKSKVLVKVSKKNEDYMVVYSVVENSWTNIEIVNHNYYAIWYEESWVRPTEYENFEDDGYIEELSSSALPWRVIRKADGKWERTEFGIGI